MVEKTAHAHDKVCGEFLSADTMESLRVLGVDLTALGAPKIENVRLAGRFGASEARLPFAAMSLSRRVLDEALLCRAEDAGARVLRGLAVERLEREADGWHARLAGAGGSETMRARQVVLATGKHDLRGLPRPPGVQSDLVAFKMYFRLGAAQAVALERYVELLPFDGGYAGLMMVGDGAANLCCVVRKRRLQTISGGWEGVLTLMARTNRLLRERMEGAEALLEHPLAASGIPYGFVRREAIAGAMWAVGDQAAVIPSFTGDGMAMALHSGRMAARMLLAGESAEAYQRRLHAQVRRQVGLATVLSRGLVAQPQCAVLECAAGLWPGALRVVATGTRLAAGHFDAPRRQKQLAAT
jgi:flavin-dependent dehydrogenase